MSISIGCVRASRHETQNQMSGFAGSISQLVFVDAYCEFCFKSDRSRNLKKLHRKVSNVISGNALLDPHANWPKRDDA